MDEAVPRTIGSAAGRGVVRLRRTDRSKPALLHLYLASYSSVACTERRFAWRHVEPVCRPSRNRPVWGVSPGYAPYPTLHLLVEARHAPGARAAARSSSDT